MTNSYPVIYKRLVINKYLTRDYSINELSIRYNISKGSLYNWKHKNDNGITLDKKSYTKKSKYTAEIKCFIRAYVLKYKSFKCINLISLIKRHYNIDTSKSSIYRILEKMNITYKKNKKKTDI